MSDNAWVWAVLAVALVLALVGLWLLLGDRLTASRTRPRHARPSRDQFRADDAPPPPPKRAAVIINPTKFEDPTPILEGVHATCERLGWDEPLVLRTTAEDVGTGQARQALAEAVDVVCVLGGDGTVRTVAQELVGSGLPLGLLGGGTGNLLARNLALPTDDVTAAVEVALTGRNKHIDVGWAVLDPTPEQSAGDTASAANRYAFLVIAGLGLDAAIMENTSEELKAKMGWTAYVPAGVKNLLVRRFKAHMSVDGAAEVVYRARTILIGNCGKIQGGINLMPEAEPDDGILDIVAISPRGVAGWAGVAAKVLSKSEKTTATLDRYRGESVAITVEHRQKVELDGDILGEADAVMMSVHPRGLIVRTPAPAP